MPTFCKTHEDNRGKVCIICFGKGVRPLTDNQKSLVQKHVFTGFEQHEGLLPKSICNNCRTILGALEGPKPRSLPPKYNYEKLIKDLLNVPPVIRSRSEEPSRSEDTNCSCEICRVGKSMLSSFGAAHKLPAKPDRGKPTSTASASTTPLTATPVLLCNFCFSAIGKGQPHTCNRTTRLKNVESVLSPKTKDQLTSSIIRKKAQQKESGAELTLATGGKPMAVSAGGGAKKKLDYNLPHQSMLKMQTSLNLSDRQVLEAGKIIREGIGNKKAIEPNLQSQIALRGKSIEGFFQTTTLAFLKKLPNGEVKEVRQPVTFCNNVSGLINFLCEKRSAGPSPLIKIGMDGGGGSLKFCLNVINQQGIETQKSKSKFLDSGVKKLLIIAITFEVQELYENIQAILRILKIQNLDFIIACGLKLANVLCGLQSHASKFPCTWCEATQPWSKPCQPRTLGRIRKMVQAYRNSGSQLKKASDFLNCIHEPLMSGEDETPVLSIIPPPELHLMLGAVNKIFEELNKAWGDNKGTTFASRHNICRTDYFGGGYEGNQCKEILKKVDLLAQELPPALQKFAEALRSFDAVRKSCFGEHLSSTFMSDIELFRSAYMKLQISVTPKIHAIIDHVPEFCQLKKVGLGKFSEQASESVHSDFQKTWQRFAVPLSHEQVAKRLLQAVIKYNSLHQ